MKGPLLVTAAIIENPAGEILLTRRPLHHKIAGGLWEFPGGKVEAGENPRDGLVREILEELGVTITLGPLEGVFSYVYRQGTNGLALDIAVHVVLAVYRAKIEVPFEFKFNDVADAKWVSSKTYPLEPLAPADIEIAESIWPL